MRPPLRRGPPPADRRGAPTHRTALVIGAPVAQLVRAAMFLGATRRDTEIGAALLGATIAPIEAPTGAADDMAALVVPADAPDWDTIRRALETVGLDVIIQPVTAPD